MITEVFGTAFWLGFGVNLVAAEIWITKRRGMLPSNRTPQPAGVGRAAVAGDARV
jgi:hypothetical protein